MAKASALALAALALDMEPRVDLSQSEKANGKITGLDYMRSSFNTAHPT